MRVAQRAIAACTLIFAITTIANEPPAAPTTTSPRALGVDGPYVFTVFPLTGKVNQPRKLFLTRTRLDCTTDYSLSLDVSAMDTQNLIVLRSTYTSNLGACPAGASPPFYTRHEFEFTPRKTGALSVRWDLGGGDLTVQTVSTTPASKFDVNGMWLDPATNGSGIAIHHQRATSDAAFGTWFLFDNNGDARWYTLQVADWRQDGGVLEGLLVRVDGACPSTMTIACPATGRIATAQGSGGVVESATKVASPAFARITFQSATRARADVSSLSGGLLFTSDLTKLQF